MNAIYGSIVENLKHINIIYDETTEVFKKDRTNTSDSKEVTVADFIRSYLPSDFQVKIRSKIFSKTQETNNIDCVVLSPNHPKLITPVREITLAEGVFVAVEVKPDITTLTKKGEFMKGLMQIKSVKNISRTVQRLDLSMLTGEKKPSDYFDKIPGVIFTSKSSDLEKVVKFIAQKVKDGTLKVDEIPDLIVNLSKGVISYSPVFEETTLAEYFKNKNVEIPKRAFVTYESSEKASILILFLRYFLNFTPSYHSLTKFIVTEYLDDVKTDFKIKLHNLDDLIK